MDEAALLDVAAAVADGDVIDWASATQTAATDEDRRTIESLRFIADLTQAQVRRSRNDVSVAPTPPGAANGQPPPLESDGQFDRWGPLEILEKVGRGTFGDVYRAWDSRLDREVALKVVRRRQPADESSVSTVIEEGRLLARVRHPNIVTVYGAERIDGRIGVWMEFVHGKTLEDELRERGPFEAGEAVEIGLALSDALATVHRAGLLHRDVKTHNVMRDRDGRLLLTDFGAGCELVELADGHSGRLIGTPVCVAPEVLAGADASPQSDIYSLGVLLYHLLTGVYPVQGRSLDEVSEAHARGDRTSLRAARPDLPALLVDVVDRALDVDPTQRYDTAEALAVALVATAREQSGAEPDAPRVTSRRLWAAAALASVLVAGGIAVWKWQKAEAPVIAVLPLKNLDSEAGSGDFVDGLTDEIIRNLAMIQGLEVRSRTSSFTFKDKPRNLREVGRQLAANLAIEGSVQRSDGRIRINAQLVRVTDDVTLWSGRFDRELKDIFAIQDEISRSIVNELRLKLGKGPRRYDTDVDAYEPYLRARASSDHKDPTSLRTAIELFNRVIAKDAAFAPAYAGLADAYADLSINGRIELDEAYSQIRRAAVKALELDPLLPEAHAAMGVVYSRDREWANAEKAFRRAIEINPSLSRTHTGYAYWTLLQMGKLDEGLRQLDLALTSDPLSLDIRRVMALLQINAGLYDEAIRNSRLVLSADPNFPFAAIYLARALMLAGQQDEGLEILRRMGGGSSWFAYWNARLGHRAEAEAMATAAATAPLTQAVLYAGLGDTDRAFDALERGAIAGDPKVGGTLMYPELAALRTDPRFAAFRERIGLAQ